MESPKPVVKNNKAVIITGVSGSGKTTVGIALAERLKASFHDADGFHSESNITKMSSGIPLSDADRQPWLQAINKFIKEKLLTETVVVTCSALRESYRKILSADINPSLVIWVHLQGDYDLIYERMRKREGHFMTADMLRSQMDAYEEPGYGISINVNQDFDQTIELIMSKIGITKSDVGLVGLGVMGTSLARNIAGKGFAISIYNRHVEGKEEYVAKKMADKYPELNQSSAFDDLEKFVLSLRSPRKIFLMVNAGKAVDDVIQKLLPLLEAGDVIVDGGNSHYTDTSNRQKQLAEQGVHFVGAGVSGGEEGAILGPSIMPGGSKQGFELVKDILLAIAAKNNLNETCCDYIGDGGAGHFVKMVHNGIEYAEMQLIAEFYSHLRYDQKIGPEEIAKIFNDWNQGDASSYLLGITVDILRFKDIDGLPLLDKISDVAGNKGTGSWTTITACELGVPIPAMAEALFSRYLSSFKNDRLRYSDLYASKDSPIFVETDNMLQAYMFCRIINHYQGLKLIQEASQNFGWNIDTEVLLRIWSGGCIIRSPLLSILRNGWLNHHSDVMQHTYTQKLIKANFPMIKDTVSKLVLSNRAHPVISSCLDYYKYLISPRSTANMIQAQRDYFGAHRYQRADDPTGTFYHSDWV